MLRVYSRAEEAKDSRAEEAKESRIIIKDEQRWTS
jgi:hypothetical protein